ncbi:MAG: DMT family transporter [Rickettsiales bacterium]
MPLLAILAAITVSFCWGANFTASKFAMEYFPPFLTILIRFVGLSVVLLPFIVRQKIPNLKDMLILSLLYITCHFAMIFFAMYVGLSVTSAIIATQLGVPFSSMLAAIFFKDYLGPWRTAGLALAFAGVVVVAGAPDVADHSLAFGIGLVGALGWAASNIHMKRMASASVTATLFWPGVFAIPQMAILSLLFESGQVAALQNAAWTAWAGVTYSALMSSIVGYGLWTWLLARYAVNQVVPYSLLVPVFGISCGMIFFGERMTAELVVGALLTVAGVAIITLRRPKLAELERV